MVGPSCSLIASDRRLFPAPTSPAPQKGKEDRVWQVGGKFTFRADFDSANLALVKEGSLPSEFQLWTFRDCAGTPHQTHHRSWFYFGVSGGTKGDFIVITIMNMNKQTRLYSEDYRPLYRSHPSMTSWRQISTRVTFEKGEDFKLRFHYRFESKEEVLFAFAIPFSYTDTQELLSRIDRLFAPHNRPDANAAPSQNPVWHDENSRIYYKRQLLATSLDGRRIDCITISDCTGMHGNGKRIEIPGVFPEAPTEGDACEFEGKKVFFVSARVHPGETPATHLFHGILSFLLRKNDKRAAAARRHFVFKLVPLVNPDGVARGHYRMDDIGQNLNRYYMDPDRVKQPAIFALKALLMHYHEQGKLQFYFDLHAHANKQGVFTYGNALEGSDHIETLLYSKLAAMNSPHFDFRGCNFTEKNMIRPDKDGSTKDGAGRVALYRNTGLVHLYTVESNYNCARFLNQTDDASGSGQDLASPPCRERHPIKFTDVVLHGVGRTLVVAALDVLGLNPWSRVPNSEFKTVDGVRNWVVTCLKSACEKRDARFPAISEASSSSVRSLEMPNIREHGPGNVARRLSDRRQKVGASKSCTDNKGSEGGKGNNPSPTPSQRTKLPTTHRRRTSSSQASRTSSSGTDSSTKIQEWDSAGSCPQTRRIDLSPMPDHVPRDRQPLHAPTSIAKKMLKTSKMLGCSDKSGTDNGRTHASPSRKQGLHPGGHDAPANSQETQNNLQTAGSNTLHQQNFSLPNFKGKETTSLAGTLLPTRSSLKAEKQRSKEVPRTRSMKDAQDSRHGNLDLGTQLPLDAAMTKPPGDTFALSCKPTESPRGISRKYTGLKMQTAARRSFSNIQAGGGNDTARSSRRRSTKSCSGLGILPHSVRSITHVETTLNPEAPLESETSATSCKEVLEKALTEGKLDPSNPRFHDLHVNGTKMRKKAGSTIYGNAKRDRKMVAKKGSSRL